MNKFIFPLMLFTGMVFNPCVFAFDLEGVIGSQCDNDDNHSIIVCPRIVSTMNKLSEFAPPDAGLNAQPSSYTGGDSGSDEGTPGPEIPGITPGIF